MGIDYGMGLANIDPKTGFRYGVIPSGLLVDWVEGEAEAVYPTELETDCPECGAWVQVTNETTECPSCGEEIAAHVEREFEYLEPEGWSLESDGVQLYRSQDSLDWWCFESTHIMRGNFCSPCAPGAIYLNGFGDDAYALSPPADWFRNLAADNGDDEEREAWVNEPVSRLENLAALED